MINLVVVLAIVLSVIAGFKTKYNIGLFAMGFAYFIGCFGLIFAFKVPLNVRASKVVVLKGEYGSVKFNI